MKKISLYSVGAVFALLMVLFACTSEDDSSALMDSLSKEKTEKKSTDIPDSLQADNALSPDSSANPYALSEEEKNGLLAYAKSKDITIVLDDNPSGPVDVAAIKQLIDGLAKPFKIVAIDSIPVTGRFPRLRSSAEQGEYYFTGNPMAGTQSVSGTKNVSYTKHEPIAGGNIVPVTYVVQATVSATVSWSKLTNESAGSASVNFSASCSGYSGFCTPAITNFSFKTNGLSGKDYKVESVNVNGTTGIQLTPTGQGALEGLMSISFTAKVTLTCEGSSGRISI